MSCLLDGCHHFVRADCDNPIYLIERNNRLSQLTTPVSQYSLDDVAPEMRILWTSGLDRSTGVGTPDDLIRCGFNFLPLKKILTLFVAGKVDDTISFFAHTFCDGEQYRITE